MPKSNNCTSTEWLLSSLRPKELKLVSEERVSEELAINSAKEGFEEVERLLVNHTEAV